MIFDEKMSLLEGGSSFAFMEKESKECSMGPTFMLPEFCIPAKVCLSYRLTHSNSNTTRLDQLPWVPKRISHSPGHLIQPKMLPEQDSVQDGAQPLVQPSAELCPDPQAGRTQGTHQNIF